MADRRLKVFHTVARLLSFTKAADALHMTQPAVTFQIRQLEEHFNTRLFDRTHNRVSLTEVGTRVFEYADRVFELYDEMENSVKEMTGEVSGVLTIGASTTVAEYLLPALLGGFKGKFPDVNVRLKVSNTDSIVAMVENNAIELGIVEGVVSNKNLVLEQCRPDELVVVTPTGHELAKQSSVTADELMKYDFICREEGSGTREAIFNYLQEHGHSNCFESFLELGSPEAIKGAVEAGLGLSIVSRVIIAKERKLDILQSVPLNPPLVRSFSFVRQRHKFRNRAMEELFDYALAYCKECTELGEDCDRR